MGQCHFCGTELPADLQIFRETECPSCERPLKICLNCQFYQPGAHWDCKETIPEAVREKDRANFCDYFRLRPGAAGAEGGGAAPGTVQDQADQARTDFDQLFQ